MYSIHQTHFLIEKHLEHQLAEAKCISFAQFLVLLPICRGDHISQTDIADATFLTEATVSRHMSALTEEGLLSRKEDPDNRRKHILALTQKGEKELIKAQKIIEKVSKNVFDGIPLNERAHIARFFDGIVKGLLENKI